MRLLCALILTALLGIAPLAAMTALAADEAWVGVTIQSMTGADAKDPLQEFLGADPDAQVVAGGLVDRLAAYQVDFGREHAHVPEVAHAEFMIIVVLTDGFVLDVYNETLVVDPMPPRAIDTLKGTEVTTPSGDHEISYSGTGEVLHDDTGEACLSMCTVLPGTAVALMEGDRIIAPPGHKCYYCLLNGDEGSLLVYPLLRTDASGAILPFSWIASHNAISAATPSASLPAGDDVAEAPARSGMLAWAFFNPAPNCRNGPH